VAGKKDIPRVFNPPAGDGHRVTQRFLSATELAERNARQDAFERNREVAAEKHQPRRAGCVFAKSCKLPDAIIDYTNPSGMVPTDSLNDYGELILLGARESDDSGGVPLKKISAGAIPVSLGSFALAGEAFKALPAMASAAVMAPLLGLVLLLKPTNLGDSALYTEDQLLALRHARTRVRLRVEQQADGSLKGYGFYTGKNRDWEMVDVVQFTASGSRFIADLGEGIELIWTPAVDGSDILGIPALEAAPLAPPIWVYPPTKAADGILVNPVYPPEYRDFILVFPAGSGVRPVYIVLSTLKDFKYHPAPTTLSAFPEARPMPMKTSVRGGAKKRRRWKDTSGKIYEWDSQHGKVEMYTKQGKHLGEFDPKTGVQTKPADPTRRVEK
jgi:hypothetical protein